MNIEKHLRASFKYKKLLDSLCQPLFKKTCLSYFGYNRYYPEKKWCGIYSDPDLVRRVLENETYPIVTCDKGFSIPDGFYHASEVREILYYYSKEDMKISKLFGQENVKEAQDMNHAYYIFRSNEFYLESFFFFPSSLEDPHSVYYFKSLSEMKNFSTNFLYQARKAIEMAVSLREGLPPPHDEGIRYRSKKKNLKGYLKNNKYSAPTPWGDVFLSKQERFCLYYLARGLSAKKIAEQMDLKVKTIENYLVNLKNKTGLIEREDLLSLDRFISVL